MTTARWGHRLSHRKDVDDVVVERLVAGNPPVHPPTCLEVQAAIDELDRLGYPAIIIAERVGTTPRSVCRRRAARRKAAA